MGHDLTALLERLPSIKASDLSGLTKQKRWELSLTPEQVAARNKRRRKLRKLWSVERLAKDRADGRARYKAWYEKNGKARKHR